MVKKKAARGRARGLVLVSNRLPVSIRRTGRRWSVQPSSGGLVTALGPVLRNRGGRWIGWPGDANADVLKRLGNTEEQFGFALSGVSLTREEQQNFYQGFSNEIIWPLFHGLQSRCNYDPAFWRTYTAVNRKFAAVVARNHKPGSYLWVHDYHLMCAGRYLRDAGVGETLGFFLHIPFPPPDIFQKLPWRTQILRDLLAYDLIGFQTERHKRNFLQSLRMTVKEAVIRGKGTIQQVSIGARTLRVGSFPIGIDYESFFDGSQSLQVERQVADIMTAFGDTTLVLGVDRLDYTKGVPDRLKAFRHALATYPELKKKLTLVQVVVPSREDIHAYHELKTEIDQLVGEINGDLSTPDWTPIHYLFRNLRREELIAYYRAAKIGLVTPLEDGMNLVAKEYCAVRRREEGVLILSEFAGAAAQMQTGALLVNPYDVEGVATAIREAFRMHPEEKRARMRKLQKTTREQDVFWWVESFLHAGASRLEDYPRLASGEATGYEQAWWWEVD